MTLRDLSSIARARRPLEVAVATTAGVAKRQRWAEPASPPSSERARCGSVDLPRLPRHAQPPPPPAGPRLREDAPQEPGSGSPGLPGAPDAPPTDCHGRWRPRGHVAETGLLRSPSPATWIPRDREWALVGRSRPHLPWPGDSRRPSVLPFRRPWPRSLRLPSPRLQGPQRRQLKLGSARAPPPPTLQPREATAPRHFPLHLS